MSDMALVIIDVQNDYFPGGKMELEGAAAAGMRAGRALAEFRQRLLPVFHIRHLSVRPGATFFIPGTDGAEIHASVKPQAGETLVEKNFPNAFRDTDLAARLEAAGIKHLVVAGMMTQLCVDATVRAATDRGYSCTLLGDACASRAQSYGGHTIPAGQVHAAFLAALNGAYGKVVPTQEFLASLQEKNA